MTEVTAYELDQMRQRQRLAEVERDIEAWGGDWGDWNDFGKVGDVRCPQNNNSSPGRNLAGQAREPVKRGSERHVKTPARFSTENL